MSHSEFADAAPDDFEQWADVFAAHKAFSHPSELHGSLCGRLSAGRRPDSQDWLATACEHMGLPLAVTEESPELVSFMTNARDAMLTELSAADMSFQILLPDDDYSLDQRLQALSAWVRGFLEGLAMVGGESLGQAPDEIRELIEDLVAISQVAETEEDSDEGEYQLTEIAEYVRLGALAVFTEFNAPEPTSSSAQTLH